MTVSGTGVYEFNGISITAGGYPPGGSGGDGAILVNGAGGGFVGTYGNNFNIGQAGFTGSLTLTNGGGPGTVDLTFDETTGSSGVGVNVGSGAGSDGTLNILQGARLTSINKATDDPMTGYVSLGYNNVNIGGGSDLYGTGVVNVNGAGSFLGAYGLAARINIGSSTGGIGTLNVLNGGEVGSFAFAVGRSSGSTGTINIDGVGSVLNLNDAFGAYGSAFSQFSGGLQVGRAGNGTANVTNGGVINIFNTSGVTEDPYINIGREAGTTGIINVDGAGSAVNIIANGPSLDGSTNFAILNVGRNGQGTLKVENGGEVNLSGEEADLRLGRDRNGGPVGGLENLLEIKSGGTVNVNGEDRGGVIAGFSAGTSDRISIDGANSKLNIAAGVSNPTDSHFLTVGFQGSAVLDVTNGADITINGAGSAFTTFIVGRGNNDGNVAGIGVATIRGAGSTVTLDGDDTADSYNTGRIFVGRKNLSEGTLRILDGALVENKKTDSFVIVGEEIGSSGFLAVSGIGSTLNAGGILAIGADLVSAGTIDPTIGGNGRAIIRNGGTLTANDILVGNSGTLDVEGDITGNVELHGDFFVNSATIGIEVVETTIHHVDLAGDFSHEANGTVNVLIGDFATGLGDTMSISGSADFRSGAGNIALDVFSTTTILAGDVYTFATADGGLTVPNGTVTDGTLGIDFSVTTDGTNLLLTALADALPQTVTLDGGGIDDTIAGTGAGEIINGFGGNDTLSGFGGNDLLNGSAGMDELIGGGGDDRAVGGSGDDRIIGHVGNDRLDGNSGNDTILGGSGFDSITGGIGNDSLNGNADADSISGQAGADSIVGGLGDDWLSGGTGDDFLNGTAGADLIDGGAGADIVFGGIGDDLMTGGTEDDLLNGNGGTDSLNGGGGADSLIGGSGDDLIYGGDDNDFLSGQTNNDVLFGEDGNDTLNGGRGDDTLDGGIGRDTLLGSFGDDTLRGRDGNDSVQAADGEDRLEGGDGADTLRGGNDNDRLFGQNGNDRLFGDAGDDFLNGGANIDTLDGGAGNDTLTGSVGNDRFEFRNGWNDDIIVDFANNGLEKIDLSAVAGVSGIADLTITNVGGTAQIAYAGNTITVNGLGASDLDGADFIF